MITTNVNLELHDELISNAKVYKAKEVYDETMKDSLELGDKIEKDYEDINKSKKVQTSTPEMKKLDLVESLFEDFFDADDIDAQLEYQDDLTHKVAAALTPICKATKCAEDELTFAFERFVIGFFEDGVTESLTVPAEPNTIVESIKFDIVKEQIKRFNEGKLCEGWAPENYINKLVQRKHLTEAQAETLKRMINE